MVPSTPERTNPGVSDPADQLVVALLFFGGIAVVTLGGNVLPRPSAADPFEDFQSSGGTVLRPNFMRRGPAYCLDAKCCHLKCPAFVLKLSDHP